MNKTIRPEVILPAASLKKLELAFQFGADACYGGPQKYSLRKAEVDMTFRDIEKACSFAHNIGKHFYVTINIFPHERHLRTIENDLKKIAAAGPDAIIISDPGIIALAMQVAPGIPIHLSTQANTLNWRSAKFWHDLGIKRIVLARELDLKEIKIIKKKVPTLELEIFVQGAMCVAYAGRCLVSSILTDRSSNLGDCTQSCRWEYKVTEDPNSALSSSQGRSNFEDDENFADEKYPGEYLSLELEEKKRPGGYFTLEEYGDYTTWLNSKDLSLIKYIPKILDAGVDGLKIEGRNKSEFYLGIAARSYRRAVDIALDPKATTAKKRKEITLIEQDLDKFSHRPYSAGFINGPSDHGQTYEKPKPTMRFLGIVVGKKQGYLMVSVRNIIRLGDKVEIIMPHGSLTAEVKSIKDEQFRDIDDARPGAKDKLSYLLLPDADINSLIAKEAG